MNEVIINGETEYRHNWLYSVVPSGERHAIYLAGYCKTCDTAFSKEIPLDFSSNIRLSKMDVPKFGCVPQTLP